MAELISNRREGSAPVRAKGALTARVIDGIQGLTVLEHVNAIRIHSKNYVLLLMKDYSPTLGQLDGDVIFLMEDGEINLNKVKGCFKQQDNVFTLIIEEEMVQA